LPDNEEKLGSSIDHLIRLFAVGHGLVRRRRAHRVPVQVGTNGMRQLVEAGENPI